MSDLEDLKSQFLVTNSLSEAKMLSLLRSAVAHCAVDPKGHVEIKTASLSVKDKLMLVLAARLLAHNLDETISGEMTVDELAKNTHIATAQVRARMSDLAKERHVETVSRGMYRAYIHKVEAFLRALKPAQNSV